jgi:hypothetical protein
MKTKLFAAALAALTLGASLPAAAQDFRRGDEFRRDDRHRAEITIRNDGRTFSFDRRDRMFYRLLDRPYHFRPGLTYAYTDRCNRNGCLVFVFNERSRRPIDRVFAPQLPRRLDARWDGRDGRWDDRDDRDDHRRDRDGRRG